MLTSFPNLLTLSRIGAIPLIIATFYIESPVGNWVGLAVLAYAGITDFFDGFVARVLAQQTALGKFLDPIAVNGDASLIEAIINTIFGHLQSQQFSL